MCKGDIIEEYIKERREQGVVYDFIAYSGDGENDLCPTLRLSENDLAFPRWGFCAQVLNKGMVKNVDTRLQIRPTLDPFLAIK